MANNYFGSNKYQFTINHYAGKYANTQKTIQIKIHMILETFQGFLGALG